MLSLERDPKTDKQQGIEQLRIVAEKGHYLLPSRGCCLQIVAALRDKDTHTAKVLLAGLAMEFPDNKLYSKERRESSSYSTSASSWGVTPRTVQKSAVTRGFAM